jgi:peptidyl-prolyl cis-trans isomerase C
LLARRGGVEVQAIDVDAKLASRKPELRHGIMMRPHRSGSLIETILANRQLAAEAERQGLAADEVVEREVQLERERILARLLVEKYLAELPEPDYALLAREQYDAFPERFTSPEKRQVSHALFFAEKAGREDARARAEAFLSAARAAPEQWETLVGEHSDEPDAKDTKGVLPAFGKGETMLSFETAAFSMKKPQEISGIVETRIGYHVLRLESVIAAAPASFDEVKAALINQTRESYVASQYQKFIEGFRALPIEPLQENLVAIRSRYYGQTSTRAQTAVTAETRLEGSPDPALAGDDEIESGGTQD